MIKERIDRAVDRKGSLGERHFLTDIDRFVAAGAFISSFCTLP